MGVLVITPMKDETYQALYLNLTIEGETKRVSLLLRYHERTDRWLMSLTDLQTEETYLLNVPVLSCTDDAPNNLWRPYSYKKLGMLFCVPRNDNTSTENPSKDNWDEFFLIWSDGVV